MHNTRAPCMEHMASALEAVQDLVQVAVLGADQEGGLAFLAW